MSAWAIDADHLIYFDTSIQSRGGTADIMKASLVAPQSIGTAELDKGSACHVAVKKFRFSDDAEKRAQVAVSYQLLGHAVKFVLIGLKPSALRE